jgi:hypothetical protein
MSQRGFPHSETPGSKPICGSPGIIAAYRVLHRLLAPRHSPYALSSLTIRTLETTAHQPPGYRTPASALDTEVSSRSPTSAVRNRRATVSLFVVGKTTVCRIFSCQRSRRGATAPAELKLSRTGRPLRDEVWRALRSPGVQPGAFRRDGGPPRNSRRAKDGGEYRARTGDLLVANQALSQLS